MEAKNIYIVDLFNVKNFQLVTPVYQRNYAWEEKTYGELFKDLVDLIPNDLENTNSQKNYFLGTIMLKESEEKIVQTNWIIDGQQRLTTFFILVCAIKEKFHEYPGIADWCDSILFNDTIIDNKKVPKLKLKLVKTDNDVLETILKLKVAHKNKDDDGEESDLQNVMDYFKNAIDETFCINNQLNANRMEYFIDNVLKHIQVVEVLMGIRRNNEENEQLIFDRINATGVSLTLKELLCNYLLMGNKTYQQMDDLYQNKWVALENKLGNDPDALDEYLKVFFTTKFSVASDTSNEDAKRHKRNISYSSFKNWFTNEVVPSCDDDEQQARKYVFDELLKFCDYYLILTGKNLNLSFIDHNNMCLLLWLNMLGTHTYYPLVLKLIEDLDQKAITNQNLHDMLFLVLNYLVRILLLPDQKNINILFLDAYRNAFGKNINQNECVNQLKKQFTSRGKYSFVSDLNFKRDLKHNQIAPSLAYVYLLICHYSLYPSQLSAINTNGINLVNIFDVNKYSNVSYKMESTLANQAITKEKLLGKKTHEKIQILLSGEFKDIYQTLPTTATDFNEDTIKKYLDERFNFLWKIIANSFDCQQDIKDDESDYPTVLNK